MATSTSNRPRRRSEATNGRTRTVSIAADKQVAYSEYGDPDGRPVVFLHGTPGSRLLGRLFDADAQEHGVRLLAPDRPGYGRSTPWPDQSITDAETYVSAILDDADVGSASIVAFSGGSPYALATAAARPDRVSRVDLVAGATPPHLSETVPLTQRLLGGLASTTPTLLGVLFRGHAWLAHRRDPAFVVDQYTAGEATGSIPQEVATVVQADFLEAFAHSRCGAVTDFQNVSTEWGIRFEDIDVPVHLWHGDRDTNVPITDARRLETTLSTAHIHVLEGEDHLGTLLRAVPEALAAHRSET
nr:alpha/beta hydrolase [Halobellus inordinatus]